LISVEFNLAYIQNISYYNDCVSTGLDYPGGGSSLLKMCIQFLKDKKDKYGVRRIQLKDTSSFWCKNIKEPIQLSILHTLIFGDTWYGKYGFRQYIPETDKPHKGLLEAYEKNRQIVNTIKVKDTNLFNYLFEIMKDMSQKSEEEQKTFIDKYYEINKNLTIRKFFRKFMGNFQKSCDIFSRFYIKYFSQLELYNFYGHSFYLDI
jgi:hypothetical protein